MTSLQLPGVEPTDSNDTRWALETARTLWGQGERREALQWVRRAAEAAAESGEDDRALVLAKMGAELRAELEIPRTVPPPAAVGTAVVPQIAPAARVPQIAVQPVAPAAAVAPAAVAAPVATAPVAAAPAVVAPAVVAPAVVVAAPVAPPAAAPAAPAAAAPASLRASGPVSGAPASTRPVSSIPMPGGRSEPELVVTVIAADGSLSGSDASLVSRRAVRVAVTAVAPGASELRVRRLAPGEVAPKDATVALLVAFDSGGSPIPKD